MRVTVNVLIISSLCISTCISQEPCLTPNEINDWRRSAAHDTGPDDNICDSFLIPQWYKITGKGGERMPTDCITTAFKCGTSMPFWLTRYGLQDSDTTFPAKDETVDRVACSSHYSGDCCRYNVTIQIKNCTDYFVYFLRPTPYCPTGYCFGYELPCPPGQYSETGFTPNCGTFPDVTINPKPKVTTGLHRTETHTDIFKEVKFECDANIDTIYTVDVYWYINGVEITDAYYKNVPADQINNSLLFQHHWEKKYKPNMNVSCALRIRQAGYDSPGPAQFSDTFLAGLIVEYREEHKELVENDPPKNIIARLTIPVSCSYPKNSAYQLKEQKQCVVNILGAIPTYQKDSDCNIKKVSTGLDFRAVQCGIYFNHSHWNQNQILSVSGRLDNRVNYEPRVMYLRLYTNAIRGGTDKEVLKFWDGFVYPDLKFLVHDSDYKTANAVCKSDNDPHMTTFDGKRYDFHRTEGEYILYQHAQLPVEIHGFYRKCNNGALCNCGVAVRSGGSVFIANFCQQNRYAIQKVCDSQDMKVEGDNKKYKVATMSGAEVWMTFGNVYHFYGIQSLQISPSALDKGLKAGLCGSFNGNHYDDLIPKEEDTPVSDGEYFAESFRIKTAEDSLFNINYQKEIPQHAKPYCTCKKEAHSFPFGEPEFDCNYTTSLDACTKVQVTNKVYTAPCKQDVLRTKRDTYTNIIKGNGDTSFTRTKRDTQSSTTLPGEVISIKDDDAPIMYALDITNGKSSLADLTWKNSWTEEKAKQHCLNVFQNSASLTVCQKYVPIVASENYIDNCVADIRLTGTSDWDAVSVDSFATACFQVASKFENLTQTNGTSFSGEEKSIFEIIQESTCPSNCSGNGNCIGGQCLCKDPYFGPACEIEKTQAPTIAKGSFQGLCDTNVKPCHKYIISGYNFREGSLLCQYTQFTITFNETSRTGIRETADGIYVNPFSVQCPAPLSRHKRSVIGQKSSAFGYFISVSNDGKNFTEDLTVIIYNSECFECSTDNMTCYQVGSCPQETDEEDDNKLMMGLYIAIAFGILIVVIVVITIILYLKKKSKGNKSGSGIGHSIKNHTSRPPTNHRFTLPKDWIEERRDYYGPQHSSALPAIRGKEKICNDL